MNTSIDPADAARDLRTVADQRRALAEETRRPYWVYPALFVYTVGLFALEDFVPRVGFWVIIVAAFMVALGQWAPGLRLRARSLLGLRAGAAGDVVPRHTRIAVQLTMLVVVAGSLLVIGRTNLMADAGAPDWAVRHALTIYGVVAAIVMMPFTWVVDRVTRHYLVRGGR